MTGSAPSGTAPTAAIQRGPVDLYVLGLPSEYPDAGALAALTDLVDAGLLGLLDLLLVSRSSTGVTTVIEAAEVPGGFEIDIETLGATGLIGHEDVEELSASIPEGTSALLVAVELIYQRELAARTAESGAYLLAYERVPAPVVNALLDSIAPNQEV